jgi:hypothetical protein
MPVGPDGGVYPAGPGLRPAAHNSLLEQGQSDGEFGPVAPAIHLTSVGRPARASSARDEASRPHTHGGCLRGPARPSHRLTSHRLNRIRGPRGIGKAIERKGDRHGDWTRPAHRVGVPTPEFHGEIVVELERPRESDTVRVIDALRNAGAQERPSRRGARLGSSDGRAVTRPFAVAHTLEFGHERPDAPMPATPVSASGATFRSSAGSPATSAAGSKATRSPASSCGRSWSRKVASATVTGVAAQYGLYPAFAALTGTPCSARPARWCSG